MAIIPGVYQAKNAISDDSQQGSKFNSIVNAIVNPANTSLLTGFDPVIEEVSSPNVGTVVTYMPHTVSGTPPLSLPNSAGQPLESWSVDVLPYQEGTGDPSPSNVRPIHGTDKLTITTAGKNLFGGETLADAIVAKAPSAVKDTTNKTIKYTAQAINNVIIAEGFFKPNTRYTVIVNGSNSSQLKATNLKLMYTDGTSTVFGLFDPDVIAVTSEAGKTVRSLDGVWSTGTTTLNYELCGIFEGVLTADQFEPYIGTSTTLTLPQTVYTGTIGSDGGESRWGEVDLGDLAWEYIGSSNKYFQTNSIKNIVKPPVTTSIVADAMCEAYKMVSWNATTYATGLMAIAGENNPDPGRLSCINTNYTDVASFAAAMQGIKLVFELKTPTTFAVPSPTIPTPAGSATTCATAEDGTVDSMEVTYLGTV